MTHPMLFGSVLQSHQGCARCLQQKSGTTPNRSQLQQQRPAAKQLETGSACLHIMG